VSLYSIAFVIELLTRVTNHAYVTLKNLNVSMLFSTIRS